MSETVIVAILALVGSLTGTYCANRKASALIEYRLSQLENKVDKHNNLVERMYNIEKRADVFEEALSVEKHRMTDCEVKIDKLTERTV